MRFLAVRAHFPDEFGLRLTQLDYDREMAFVALTPEGELAGVSRWSLRPGPPLGRILAPRPLGPAGAGLGAALMRLLVDYARADGLERLEGMVLRENRRCWGSSPASASPSRRSRRTRGW